jgi:heme-degrading monooxygenase HmoA
MLPEFAPLPERYYYAVIFSSQRRDEDPGYDSTAEAMFKLASQQPGYIGAESARSPSGFGITVAYFESEESIRAWKQHSAHVVAQRLGKERWYSKYVLRVAKVERGYSGP